MSSPRTVCLENRTAVKRVLTLRFLGRVFLPRLVIASPLLDEQPTRELQGRVDRLVNACGCGEGAAATLIALGSYLVYAATIGPGHGLPGLIGRSLLAMFMGATVGKFAGLLRARLELRRVLLKLEGAFPDVSAALMTSSRTSI